jgi:hypothetical protein
VDRDVRASLMTMNWGQLVDHDIAITPLRMTPDEHFLDCCVRENWHAPDCCPIFTPRGDSFYGRNGRPNCIPFLRYA